MVGSDKARIPRILALMAANGYGFDKALEIGHSQVATSLPWFLFFPVAGLASSYRALTKGDPRFRSIDEMNAVTMIAVQMVLAFGEISPPGSIVGRLLLLFPTAWFALNAVSGLIILWRSGQSKPT